MLAEERATYHKDDELQSRHDSKTILLQKMKESAVLAGNKRSKSSKFTRKDHENAFIRTPKLNFAIRKEMLKINTRVLLSPFENDYQAAEELKNDSFTMYICYDADAFLFQDLHTVIFI